MGKIYACGCSFTVGMGIPDEKERYTGLLSEMLGYDEINYAVIGSSNYGVFLQARYAIEQATEDDIVIISDTSYHRCEFFCDGHDDKGDNRLSIFNIDYSQDYENRTNPNVKRFAGDPRFRGDLKMGQYWKDYDGSDLFRDFWQSTTRKKMKDIAQFYILHHPERVKCHNDLSLFSTLHLYALKKNVKHIILLSNESIKDFDVNLFDPNNLLHHDWFKMSINYPDTRGTCHCSEVAHKIVADKLYKKIGENQWK